MRDRDTFEIVTLQGGLAARTRGFTLTPSLMQNDIDTPKKQEQYPDPAIGVEKRGVEAGKVVGFYQAMLVNQQQTRNADSEEAQPAQMLDHGEPKQQSRHQ